MKNLEDYIVSVPDFPKPGIVFLDITGILDSPEGLHLAFESLYKALDGVDFDVVAGLEAFCSERASPSIFTKVSFRFGKRESFPGKPFRRRMNWNMEARPSRCIGMR